MNMGNEIDVEAFKFVEKLSIKSVPGQTKGFKGKKTDLKGLGDVIELGEVSNFGFEEFDEETYLTKRKFKNIEGNLVGLETKEYSEFKELVLKIFYSPFFSNRSDLKTLLDVSFEWLLEIYKFKKTDKNLTSFLIDKIESLTQEFYFYFKINALTIEKSITIGNAEIMFFNENTIVQHYNKFKESRPEKTFEEFKDVYKNNFDSINAFVKVKSVLNHANEIAFREAELAIDVLKCFCTYYSTEKLVQMFELDYRFHQNGSAIYLYMPDGNIKESTIYFPNLSEAKKILSFIL